MMGRLGSPRLRLAKIRCFAHTCCSLAPPLLLLLLAAAR